MPPLSPRFLAVPIGLVLLLGLVGCDLSEDDERPARLRVIHAAATVESLAFFVDLDLFAQDLAFRDASPYVEWEPGLRILELRTTVNGTDIVVSRQVILAEDTDYTVLLTGTAGPDALVLLEDDRSTIAFNRARLRAAHGAAGIDAVNVSVRPDGGGTPVLNATNLAFGRGTPHVTVVDGPYDILVNASSGNETFELLDEPLAERRVYLLVVTATPGGNLTGFFVVDG